MKTALMIGSLIGAAFLAYQSSLSGEFVYDDKPIIVKNPLLRNLENLPLIFRTPYWGMFVGQPKEFQGGLYRPLTVASFALNYSWGGLEPKGYHLTNVALHVAVVLLLWLLCLRLGLHPWGAWAAGLLYAVHPIHTEAVTSIVGRSEVLAGFFILLSWLAVTHPRVAKGRVFLGALCFALALLAKENAAAFLGVLILSDYVLNRAPFKKVAQKRLFVWVSYFGVFLLYLLWRYLLIGHVFDIGAIPYFTTQSGLVIFLTMAKFLFHQIGGPLFTGLGLCADYTRPVLADASLRDPVAWLCVLALLATVAYATYDVVTRRNRGAFFVLIFLILLFPVSNLAVHLEVIGAERFLYLPSIAWAMGLGLLFEKVLRTGDIKRVGGFILLISLSLWYAALTLERNKVWLTEESFWKALAQDAPQNPRAWNGLGIVSMGQGKYDEAIEDFNHALGFNPMLLDAHYNMATCFFMKGDFRRAKRGYLYVLERKPYDPDTLFHLGLIAEKEKDFKAAANYYAYLLQTNPMDRMAEENLVRIKGIMQRVDGVQP